MRDALMHTEEYAGFTIRYYICEEDASPRGQFMADDGSDDEELLAKIDDGTYMWFAAKVTASKAGVVLGTDYLSCCCYESFGDFLEDAYAVDMRDAAIEEARDTLKRLADNSPDF